jgi:hypothetical protein
MKNPLSVLLLASSGFVFAQDASAISVPILTVTEVNSTTLTYSWSTGQNGVLTSAGDSWSSSINGPTLAGGDSLGAGGLWAEPEGAPNNVNDVIPSFSGSSWFLAVMSDQTNLVGPVNGNGNTATSIHGFFQVTFNDNGDSVPDSGSTLLLLTLGIVGVGLLHVRSKARALPVCG